MEIYGMMGERLDTAKSTAAQPEGHTVPKWKQEFLQKPSISVRKGYARVSEASQLSNERDCHSGSDILLGYLQRPSHVMAFFAMLLANACLSLTSAHI